MMRHWLSNSAPLLTVALCLVTVAGVEGRPEYFAEAVPFGANDCSFCHLTVSGGEAVNDRGAWLISERDRRGVDEVAVSWLVDRGEAADETREVSQPEESLNIVLTEIAETKQVQETRRTLDYTTQWGEWPSYNGDLRAQKYTPLPHINKANVKDLELAWVWEANIDNGTLRDDLPETDQQNTRRRWRRGNTTGSPFQATPIMVDGKVIVRTRVSSVVAINAATGEELWEFDPRTRYGPRPPMFGFATRGLNYHQQENCESDANCGRVILVSSDGWLFALDVESGQPIQSFGTEGKVDLTQGLRRPLNRSQVSWSQPALVCNDVVVVGSQTDDGSRNRPRGANWNENLPVGDVRGFDPITGEQLWVFKTIPQEGEFGVETWGNESWKWMGNTNVWSTFSCDADLGHVYLPLTAPTEHMYGGYRPGDNLFSTSVVALNIKTGERAWHFQIVHHDIWDYDLPAPPIVADIVVDEQPRKVVAQVTKVGFLFVLDRVTGEPIWPVIEREVPASTVEGEVASPTQPHPTRPPPYEHQGFSMADANTLTPEIEKRVKDLVKNIDIGPLYTPVSMRGTVLAPGIGGGANWPGASFNPDTQQLFVSSRNMPQIARLVKVDESQLGTPYRESWGFTSIDGIPITKPPFSKITAYDLNAGDIEWQVPNGAGPKYHPLLQEIASTLPDLGDIGANPGILSLPELLVMGHGTRAGSVLKFLDRTNGTKLWETSLHGTFNNPAPISYIYGDKQYIVVGTGMALEPSRLVTFALDVPKAN